MSELSNWVHWNRFGLQMCNVNIIYPLGLHVCVRGHHKGSWNLANAGTQQPRDRFAPNQVQLKHIGLWVRQVMVIVLLVPHGYANGRDKQSWKLIQLSSGYLWILCCQTFLVDAHLYFVWFFQIPAGHSYMHDRKSCPSSEMLTADHRGRAREWHALWNNRWPLL